MSTSIDPASVDACRAVRRGLAGRAFVALLAWSSVGGAAAADLTLLCAGAMKAPVAELLARRDASAPKVVVTYGTAGVIRDRIAAGDRPDVVIAPSELVFALMKERLVDVASRRELGRTEVGVAVRADAPVPDIATPDALRATLLAARKVVVVDPAKGTSGRLVEEVFKALGIADAMRDKTIKVDGGYVVEAVARGEADVGLHQISEILPVAGVRLVGPLPGELQRITRYDIALLGSTAHRDEAAALVGELDSPSARGVIAKSGFVTTP